MLRDGWLAEDEQELRDMAKKLAEICLSPEFRGLRRELEKFYRQSGLANPARTAFQDALFSLLLEKEDRLTASVQAH